MRQTVPTYAACAVLVLTVLFASTTPATAADHALRFFGNGVNDIDRVKIRIDDPDNALPGPPADVGATDFTLEFWMWTLPAEDTAPAVSCGANINWIYGNIVFDRDRYNQDRKFGLSIAGDVVVFGVSGDGTGDYTICGTTDVTDEQWHHVAVGRRRSDGWMWLFVDGNLESDADGPDGDISYPDDGVPGNYCGGPCVNSDPFLVIGAEKHDAGAAYPSYAGWIDEIRLSNVLRYAGNFARPTLPFVTDAATVALYHLDEGTGDIITDSSGAPGGPSDGVRRFGGFPEGPEWVTLTPFNADSCDCSCHYYHLPQVCPWPVSFGDWCEWAYRITGFLPSTDDPYCHAQVEDLNGDQALDILDLILLQDWFVFGAGRLPRSFPCDCRDNPDQCRPPGSSSLGSVVIESRTVRPGQTDVDIGIFVNHDFDLSGISLPLVVREITPGAYVDRFVRYFMRGRLLDSGQLFDNLLGFCSGFTAADGPNSAVGAPDGGVALGTLSPEQSSPDTLMWAGYTVTSDGPCVPAGSDGVPGNGSASIVLTINVTRTLGTFEIDTCSVTPNYHLLMVPCGADSIVHPSFTKGVITIACECPCQGDPVCDSIHDVLDVVGTVNVAFRGLPSATDSLCPHIDRVDANCDCVVDVLDVLETVDRVFRENLAPFCNPCIEFPCR